MTMATPRQLDDLTTGWLSEALGYKVTDAGVVGIAEGEGFMGRLARLTMTYADGPDTGPATMIAKLPTDEPGSVALGQMLRVWEREARFYLDLAPLLPVRTPKCYYAGGDEASGIFAMLLEDLSEYTGGDQIAGATPEQAVAAVDWLARFHAAESGGGHARGLAWLPDVRTDVMYLGLQPMLQAVFPGFAAAHGAHAPGDTLAWVERMIPDFTEMFTREQLPPTVVHADYRLDNLFFDGGEVIALDWQAVALAQGFYDVAYFVAGSQTIEQRRANEADLVERYRLGLADGGVPVGGRDEFFDQYRETMLSVMAVAALLMGQLDLTVNQRAVDLARLGIERMYTAGADLAVDEFLH